MQLDSVLIRHISDGIELAKPFCAPTLRTNLTSIQGWLRDGSHVDRLDELQHMIHGICGPFDQAREDSHAVTHLTFVHDICSRIEGEFFILLCEFLDASIHHALSHSDTDADTKLRRDIYLGAAAIAGFYVTCFAMWMSTIIRC